MKRLAAVVAFAGLCAQLFGVAHLAQVRHATCDEHGELVELGDQPAATPAPPQQSARIDGAAAGEGAHGHDHCVAAAQRHQRVLRGDDANPTLAARRTAVKSGFARDLTPTPALPLLRVAPKTSPPVG